MLNHDGLSPDKPIQRLLDSEKEPSNFEMLYKELFQNTLFGIFEADPTGAIIFVNRKITEWTGMKAEDIVGDGWQQALHQEDKDFVVKRWIQNAQETSDFNIEFRFVNRNKDNRIKWVSCNAMTLRDQSNINGFIVIMVDITDRKIFESLSQENLEKYKLLFEGESDAILVFDVETTIYEEVNQAALDLLGYTREEFMQLSVADITAEKELTLENIAELRENEHELRRIPVRKMVRKDGTIIPVEISIGSFVSNGRKKIIGAMRDMSQRIQAEEKMHRTVENLIRSQSIGELGSWEWDILNNIVSWTDEVYRIWNWDKNVPLTYNDIVGHIHPDDQALVQQKAEEFLSSLNKGASEFRIICPDGNEKHIFQSIEVTRENNGKAVRMFGIMQDITSLKQTEKALMERDRLLNQVENIASIGGWEMDIEKGGRALWTNGIYNIVEINKNDPIPGIKDHANWYLPEYHAMINKKMDDLIKTKQPMHFEAMLKTKKGNLKWCQANGEVVEENGKVVKLRGTFQDISERKNAEEAIRREKEMAESYLNVVAEIIISLDTQGNIIMLNESGHNILGYINGELIGKNWFDTCLPLHTQKEVFAVFEKLMRGETSSIREYENQIITKNGKAKIVFWHNTLLYDESGNICGLLSSGMDISQRKEAEEKIKNEKAKYQSIFETAPIMVTSVDNHGIIRDCNKRIKEVLGYEKKEIIGQSMAKIIHPDCIEYAQKNLQEILSTGISSNKEYRMVRKDGSLIEVNINSAGIDKNDQGFKKTICIIEDMTTRKISEKRIKESEKRFRSTFEQAAVGIAHISLDGTFLRVNNKYCEIVGYEREELFHMDFAKITSHEEIEKGRLMSNQLLNSELESYTREKNYTRKNGEVILGRLTVSLIKDDNGQPEYFVSILEDITEKKNMEDSIREKNAALTELINHLESDRKEHKDRLCNNVYNLFEPVLQTLQKANCRLSEKELDILKQKLEQVAQRDVDVLKSNLKKLTPRELDICDGIKSGLSSKEIASELNIQASTVEGHRKSIRRKLRLKNRNINLSTILRSD